MTLTDDLQKFWNEEIKSRFSQSALVQECKRDDNTIDRTIRGAYLDNAATTKPFRAVIEQVVRDLDEYGSVHRGAGHDSEMTTSRYEYAREAIRQFVGASDQQYVIFTKNTMEAINHAAALWARISGAVLVSDIEHSSNLLPWITTQKIIQYRTNDRGEVDPCKIEHVLAMHSRPGNKKIKLLAITGASNVTGYRPPIHALAQLAHRYGAKILVDICQLLQHTRVDMRADDDPEHLDFIAFSGHKMYAPFGAGVLIGSKEFFDRTMPYQIGGGNLPYLTSDLRISRFSTVQTHDPGTPNAIGVIAIARAMSELNDIGVERIAQYEHELSRFAITELKKNGRVRVYAAQDHGSVLPFDIDGFSPKLVAQILAQEFGIGTRAGSFCTYELIRKLKGISNEEDRRIAQEVDCGITTNIPGVVRASFSVYNSLDDAKRFVEAVNEISQKGREHYHRKYCMNEVTGEWV